MILDEFYLGNIHPAEDAISDDPKYQQLNNDIMIALDALTKSLSSDHIKLLDQFHSKVLALQCYESSANFKFGFTLGFQMASEIYTYSKHEST